MGCCGKRLKALTRPAKAKGGGRSWIKGFSNKAKPNDILGEPSSKRPSTIFDYATCDSSGNRWLLGSRIEEVAATKIQASYRAYRARNTLLKLKGIARLKKILAQDDPWKIQAVGALHYFHTYSKIQDQIQTRRLNMVVEGRLRQKKLEKQLKVDAKLHEIETDWSCTPDSKDRLKAKILTREEAALKRERAMAYAFNHQWRPNASKTQLMGNSEHGNAEWGWSWRERWIAARPWEMISTLKTENSTPTFKVGKTKTKIPSTPTKSSSPKPILSSDKDSTTNKTFSNGKIVLKPQKRVSFPSLNKSGLKKDVLKTIKPEKDQ